jgi:hypothetical protein
MNRKADNTEVQEVVQSFINEAVIRERTLNCSADDFDYAIQRVEIDTAGEYRYAMLGLILGLATILGGCLLCLNGVAGHTSWTAKAFGLQSQINDAAPGVVLFIVGIFFVLITRPKVDLRKLR